MAVAEGPMRSRVAGDERGAHTAQLERRSSSVTTARRVFGSARSLEVITLGAFRTIAILGNHAPRECGIATFTTDLGNSIAAEFDGSDCFVLAMNDAGRSHGYPSRVRFEIAESDLASYRRAADFLNVNAVDVVSVQHEYGIFGG